MSNAGTTPGNLLLRNIAKNTTSSSNNSICSNSYPRSYKIIRSNPDSIPNSNRKCCSGKTRIAKIMTGGTKIGFLGNDSTRANFNLIDAIKNYIITNPTIISNRYFSKIGKASRRTNNNSLTNFGTK